jgi:hypothetical protein
MGPLRAAELGKASQSLAPLFLKAGALDGSGKGMRFSCSRPHSCGAPHARDRATKEIEHRDTQSSDRRMREFYPLARARSRYSGSPRAKGFCGGLHHQMCKKGFACRCGMRCVRSSQGRLYKRRRIPPGRLEPRGRCLAAQAHCKNPPLITVNRPVSAKLNPRRRGDSFFTDRRCGAALPVRSTPYPRRQALPLARARGSGR